MAASFSHTTILQKASWMLSGGSAFMGFISQNLSLTALGMAFPLVCLQVEQQRLNLKQTQTAEMVYNFERLKANQDSLLLEVKHLQAELKQAMETQESHVPAYRGKVKQLQQEQRELKLKVASIEQQVSETKNSFVLPVKESKPQQNGTAIFVDAENLYHCAKEKGMDIDLNKICN